VPGLVLELERVPVLVLEPEPVLEPVPGLVPEQELEPVRALGLVPHRQRQSCLQLPLVLV
jgi:hypothetical protein